MIWSVVRTGWMNLSRDRAAWMLSFVVPIVFFSIFASIFGAQRRSTPRVTVVVVDEDRSERSKRLVDALRAEAALKVMDAADTKAGEAIVKKATRRSRSSVRKVLERRRSRSDLPGPVLHRSVCCAIRPT